MQEILKQFVGDVASLAAVTADSEPVRYPYTSDEMALSSDWASVGQDIAVAMSEMKHEFDR